MANNNLIVSGLDFAEIKRNLKIFLDQNTDFTDHNFEGSGLTALVNLLSQNTQYNAFYLNAILGEAFLDPAISRNSVISLAKSLSYVPNSATGARAKISIAVSEDGPDQIILETTDRFECSIDGVSYALFPVREYTAGKGRGDTYTFDEIELRQGIPLETKFIVTGSETQKFILENENIDHTTIQVKVYDNYLLSSYKAYAKAESVIALKSTSEVFFIQESVNNKTEIYFGDDIIGKAPAVGNVIVVNYLVTAGDLPNGAKNIKMTDNFVLDGLIADTSVINAGLTVLEPVNGGAFAESLRSIKLKAPRNYAGQQRAVTENDYKFFIEQVYPNIDSVRVWGGQDNDPPFYGKVFISIKPNADLVLDNDTKDAIAEYLNNRNIITILPVLVDPDFIYLKINSLVKFNSNLTTYNNISLPQYIKNIISDYCDENLNSFDRSFRYSKLLNVIDECDASILSNITSIKLKKVLTPDPDIKDYIIQFNNTIKPGSILTNTFTVNDPTITTENNSMLFLDDYNSALRLVRYNTSGSKIVLKTIGNVDYLTGKVTISNLLISSITNGATFKIEVTPESNDISIVRNSILTVLDADITVNTISEIS